MQWQYEYQFVVCALSAVRRVTVSRMHTLHMSTIRAARYAYLIPLDLITPLIVDEYKL